MIDDYRRPHKSRWRVNKIGGTIISPLYSLPYPTTMYMLYIYICVCVYIYSFIAFASIFTFKYFVGLFGSIYDLLTIWSILSMESMESSFPHMYAMVVSEFSTSVHLRELCVHFVCSKTRHTSFG